MANFNLYAPKTHKLEGVVFENDPTDTAGATKYGITTQDVRDYYKDPSKDWTDVKALTADTAALILKKLYWDRLKADEIVNQSLAEYFVDSCFNMGFICVKYVQRIIGVPDDGIWGSGSLAALNAADPEKVFEALRARREQRYAAIIEANPSQKKFERGWKNRLNAFDFEA